MKQLILVRHAKSDWPEDTDDFHRPLAERGEDDAHKMALHLKNKKIPIDKLVSSPAVRALKTAEIFNKTFEKKLDTDLKLYHASENNFISVISQTPAEIDSIAIFSHNNGISNFANYITQEIFTFPTCGVAGFEVHGDSWEDFENLPKKLSFFFEPKKL